MELQRLNQNEESDKRKRGIALKASSSFQEDIDNEDSDDEEDFSLDFTNSSKQEKIKDVKISIKIRDHKRLLQL